VYKVWHGHILSSDIGLVFGLVLLAFGLVLIGHWSGFVTQTWQPWSHPQIIDAIRVTETGHFADDGNQAPDTRELSLTVFNGKEYKQTIKAHDRGFRGDTGSPGTSSEDPG